MLDLIDSRYDYIFDVLEHDVLAGDLDMPKSDDIKRDSEVKTLLEDNYRIEKWGKND